MLRTITLQANSGLQPVIRTDMIFFVITQINFSSTTTFWQLVVPSYHVLSKITNRISVYGSVVRKQRRTAISPATHAQCAVYFFEISYNLLLLA